ncbi:MAG: carboxypeptidase-like regulatory domain-containing protein [Winogradskyella sp.]|uniref:carboxypeptidase-like regulatory domain-containing protein n=1 Tax=Winogradskyella sp. TaxID=1883156 RepID=UPI0025E3E415|nr:carboxypeptidase-like regulatory domain-containing protein [Winogradskyella sp.]NRB60215.1 carboxypeptidase-like regulatory domain-containing protein [Winogradskyella sp.]
MKLKLKLLRIDTILPIKLFGMVMLLFMTTATVSAQKTSTNERTITGIIIAEGKPVAEANITLQGTKTGVMTGEDGTFTFPKKLKAGDILVFSYLGYETQKVTIMSDTSYIKLEFTVDMIEMIGALDDNTPYKSKRKN